MDLRTKLIFALVMTSLVSTTLLGLFAYQAASAMLRELTAEQLDTLVNTRAEDFDLVGEAWQEALQQVRSRTELRRQLAHYADDPVAVTAKVQKIVTDSQEGGDVIQRVSVFSTDGALIAASGEADFAAAPRGQPGGGALSFTRYERDGQGGFYAVLHSTLAVGRELVGYMESVVDIGGILALANNHRGLGETGETLLITQIEPDTVTVLNGTRHGDQSSFDLPLTKVTPAMGKALAGESAVLKDVLDYRGELVWAATRAIESSGVGIIVKVDAAEKLRPLHDLRHRMIDMALSVGALAILAGAVLAFYLARPIQELDVVVHKIRKGDTALRADESGEDEISYLAESFNELMDRVYGPPRGARPDESGVQERGD